MDKDILLSYKKWLKENYAVSSANSMLAALNQYLDYLGAPELKVKPYRMQRSLFLQEEKELTRNEFTRLVRAADRDGKEWLALCMETIFRNRRGEALDRSRIWREMKSLKDRTGIDPAKIFPHNLRHLFARVYYQCTRDMLTFIPCRYIIILEYIA